MYFVEIIDDYYEEEYVKIGIFENNHKAVKITNRNNPKLLIYGKNGFTGNMEVAEEIPLFTGEGYLFLDMALVDNIVGKWLPAKIYILGISNYHNTVPNYTDNFQWIKLQNVLNGNHLLVREIIEEA